MWCQALSDEKSGREREKEMLVYGCIYVFIYLHIYLCLLMMVDECHGLKYALGPSGCSCGPGP